MAGAQGELVFKTRGGKRKGAGRKPKGKRSGVSHATRPEVTRHVPQHVTLRTVPDVGKLRRREVYRVVQQASFTSVGYSTSSERCRICQISIQGNHLHLIVEADDKQALSRGMQGFQVSCAKRLNAAISKRTGAMRKGSVFSDRYHARPIRTPRQARNAIVYCLNNWRRHRERGVPAFAGGALDPYATGMFFDGWIDYGPVTRFEGDPSLLMIWAPTAWLLTTGWKRHGLPSTRDVPGPS